MHDSTEADEEMRGHSPGGLVNGEGALQMRQETPFFRVVS